MTPLHIIIGIGLITFVAGLIVVDDWLDDIKSAWIRMARCSLCDIKQQEQHMYSIGERTVCEKCYADYW